MKSREDKKMVRVGNLWESMCSMTNATLAIQNGTLNKRFDFVVVRKLGYTDGIKEHLGKLDPEKVTKYAKKRIAELKDGWTPSPMKHMVIKPVCGKKREIDCPCLNDHIIHWMLMQTIKAPIMRGMYEHSYGSIPGRGIDGARRAIERWVQHDEKAKYFAKLDIRKFYEHVDHDKLKESFRRLLKDDQVLTVIERLIDVVPNGLPIGTYTSQWFANFYLQQLDHHVAQDMYKLRRGKRTKFVSHYLRYMDDMLLIGTSKRDLEKAIREIIRYCREELKLEIKPCWEIKVIARAKRTSDGQPLNEPNTAPIDIVGYRFYRDHTEVRGRIFLHASRIAVKVAKRLEEKGEVILQNAQALVSLCGWFEHADSEYFLANYINNKVNYNFLKGVISYAAKNGIVGDASRIYCHRGEGESDYRILYGCSAGAARRRFCVHGDDVVYGGSEPEQP